MRVRRGALASCLAVAVVLPSCSSASSDSSYYAVRALVSTGANGTDGNVQLCFTVNGVAQCHNLSSDHNDFEAGTQETFDVYLSPRVPHGTPFSGFSFKYTTGLSIGDTWEVTGLRATLYYADGQAEPICDAMFDTTISDNGAFAVAGCP